MAGIIIVVGASIGIGQLMPAPSASPETSDSVEATPSEQPAGACEDVRPPASGRDIVLVYFPCGPADSLDLVSGARSVAEGLAIEDRVDFALRALLDGPTQLESQAGMSSVVPVGSADLLIGVEVAADGLARVDFAPAVRNISNLSTSNPSRTIPFLRAIRETGLQFDEVTALELRLDGSCGTFFVNFNMVCQHLAEPVSGLGDCSIIAPWLLPGPEQITAPRRYPGLSAVSWGSGRHTVTETLERRIPGSEPPLGEPVTIRGVEGVLLANGAVLADATSRIYWEEAGCEYSIALRIGPEEARAYAEQFRRRFGQAQAPPAAPAAVPVTTTAEELGIRLTLTLDRDRTIFGQRVWADVTVENLGPHVVFWEESGLCPWPVLITAAPDSPTELDQGRDDWPGDLGIFKSVTVGSSRVIDRDLQQWLHNRQQWFLTKERIEAGIGNGCFPESSSVELPRGASVGHRAGWDTDDYLGMPPVAGSYTVEATFAFTRFGDRETVSVRVPLVVEGPDVDWVTPGLALDALLSEEDFAGFVTSAPRERWGGHSIAFEDDQWVVAHGIYAYEPTESGPPPAESLLVGVVDARTGEVLDVRLENPRD